MKSLFLLCLIAVPSAAAQDASEGPPKPAAEIARFHDLIGSFEGEGTLVMEPGATPGKWTGTAVGASILGGHVVQFDETIQTPMGPMEFRTLYGWDRERKRPVSIWVGTMGAQKTDVVWVDQETLVGVDHGFQDGTPNASRWVMRIGKDGYTFTMDSLSGTSQPFQHVSGSLKRTSKPAAKRAQEAAAATQGAEMKALAPLCGTYDIAGRIDMMGMRMDITARETVEWSFGGAAIYGHVAGEPGGYQCDWYIAWDPTAGNYRHVYATNMGEIGIFDGWLHDGKLVTTHASTQAGVPGVERGVTVFGKDGIQRAWSDRMSGAGEVVRTFDGTYTRAAKTAAAPKYKAGSCCDKAVAAGKTCAHPCCIEAEKSGTVCAACNG